MSVYELYKKVIKTRSFIVSEMKERIETVYMAISELPSHSATLITSDERAIMNQCYRHAVVTEINTEE